MHLAIDTATNTASLALVKEEGILAELTWCCGRNHTTSLLPHLVDLLRQTDTELAAITGIIVARGPGSFNGLRAGLSAAKGLSLSLNVPLVGISTLEATAFQHAAAGLVICPILNARRGEVATALYQMKNDSWLKIAEEHISTVATICSQINERTIFCGEIDDASASYLKENLNDKAIIPSPAARLRRAGFLAELGQKQLKSQDSGDPASVHPLYLRAPKITKPSGKKV